MTYEHRAETVSRPGAVRWFTPRGGCTCTVSDGRRLTTGDVVAETDIAYTENTSRMRQVDAGYVARAQREQAADVDAGILDAVPAAEREHPDDYIDQTVADDVHRDDAE